MSSRVKLVLDWLRSNWTVVLSPTARLDLLLVTTTVGARVVVVVVVVGVGAVLVVVFVLGDVLPASMRMDTVLLLSAPSALNCPAALLNRSLSTNTAALVAPAEGVNSAVYVLPEPCHWLSRPPMTVTSSRVKLLLAWLSVKVITAVSWVFRIERLVVRAMLVMVVSWVEKFWLKLSCETPLGGSVVPSTVVSRAMLSVVLPAGLTVVVPTTAPTTAAVVRSMVWLRQSGSTPPVKGTKLSNAWYEAASPKGASHCVCSKALSCAGSTLAQALAVSVLFGLAIQVCSAACMSISCASTRRVFSAPKVFTACITASPPPNLDNACCTSGLSKMFCCVCSTHACISSGAGACCKNSPTEACSKVSTHWVCAKVCTKVCAASPCSPVSVKGAWAYSPVFRMYESMFHSAQMHTTCSYPPPRRKRFAKKRST